MINIFNITTKRCIKIIEFLNQNSYKCSSKLLCEKLNINTNTLHNDIINMNQTYSSIFSVKLVNEKIVLKFKDSANIEGFFNQIFTNSQVLNMVEGLFFNNFSKLEDIANYQYTSIATVSRMIEKFNLSVSKKYKFIIDKKDFKFSGNEKNIRTFFLQFFREKYSVYQWPFKNINKNKLREILINLLKYENVEFYQTSLEVLSFTIATNIQRYSNNNDIIKDLDNDNMDYDRVEILKENPYMQKLHDMVNLKLTNDSIVNIFYFCLYKEFAMDFDELVLKESKIENIDMKNAMIYSFNLCRKYNIKLSNPFNLLVKIHNNLLTINKNVGSNYIIYDKESIYLSKIRKIFPDFVEDLCSYIENYLLEKNGYINYAVSNHVVCIILTSWENLYDQLYRRSDKIKTLVLSRFNHSNSIALKNQLEFFFPNLLDLYVFNEEILDLESINNEDYKLIVSDFNLPEFINADVVFINGIILKQDFLKITEIISKLNFGYY